MSKRVKYMETGYIGVVSDAVAKVYEDKAKKGFKEGKEIKVLGDAKEEPKPAKPEAKKE